MTLGTVLFAVPVLALAIVPAVHRVFHRRRMAELETLIDPDRYP